MMKIIINQCVGMILILISSISSWWNLNW
jgi:hypothetical protein